MDAQLRARKVLELSTFLLIWLNNRMSSVCRTVGWSADAFRVAKIFVYVMSPPLKVMLSTVAYLIATECVVHNASEWSV